MQNGKTLLSKISGKPRNFTVGNRFDGSIVGIWRRVYACKEFRVPKDTTRNSTKNQLDRASMRWKCAVSINVTFICGKGGAGGCIRISLYIWTYDIGGAYRNIWLGISLRATLELTLHEKTFAMLFVLASPFGRTLHRLLRPFFRTEKKWSDSPIAMRRLTVRPSWLDRMVSIGGSTIVPRGMAHRRWSRHLARFPHSPQRKCLKREFRTLS